MKKIITISREFGSGGRSIAKEVAKKLGCKYYDKELVKQVSQETGFDPKYVEDQGEYAPSKSIFAYDNKCKVADAYRNLTKEVLDIAAREKARFRNDGSR